MTVSFMIPGAPRAWARSRHSGKRHFTPAEQVRIRRAILRCANEQAPQGPPPGPLVLQVLAVFPRPASRPASISREDWKSGAAIVRPHDPDLDNVVKNIADALQRTTETAGTSLWLDDDNRIVLVAALKVYAARGDEARTEVSVSACRPVPPTLDVSALVNPLFVVERA